MLCVLRLVGGLEQETMAVRKCFFSVGRDDVLRIVKSRVLCALSGDAAVTESFGVGVVTQDLQAVGHLAREFDDSGIVVAVQSRALHIDVTEPAGVKGSSGIIGVVGGPSGLIRRSVLVGQIPAIPALGSKIREGDNGVVGELLLY